LNQKFKTDPLRNFRFQLFDLKGILEINPDTTLAQDPNETVSSCCTELPEDTIVRLLDWSKKRILRYRPELEFLEDRATPAVLTVNSLVDSTTRGDGLVSLREAIDAHNTRTATDLGEIGETANTIVFTVSGTTQLTLGQLLISGGTGSMLTIDGGGGNIEISSVPGNRLFQVDAPDALTIRNLTFRDVRHTVEGGAILNKGNTTLIGVEVRGVQYVGGPQIFGGVIFNTGTLMVRESLFTDNGNPTGAGILSGAVIGSQGSLQIVNSTFAQNTADDVGGAIDISAGTAILIHNTFVGNRANNDNIGSLPAGGAISIRGGSVLLQNNLISGNFGTNGLQDDIFGAVDPNSSNNFISVDTNLSGIANTVNGNQIGTLAAPLDPLLAPLGDYGGRTRTFALLPGSSAIDAAAAGVFNTDQRGRIRGPLFDIGAFESSGFILTPVAGSTPQLTLVDTPFPNPITVMISAVDPNEPFEGGRLGVIPVFDSLSFGQGAIVGIPTPFDSDGVATFSVSANSIPGSYELLLVVAPTSPPALLQLTNVPAISSVSVDSDSANPSFFGSPVNLIGSATLDDGTPVTQGTVILFFDGQPIGSVDLANPQPVAVPDTLLTVGPHTLRSEYLTVGGTQLLLGGSVVPFAVLRTPTQSTLSVDPISAGLGTPITVNGFVENLSPSVVPTGFVTVFVNGVPVQNVALTPDELGSVFSFTLPGLPSGENVLSFRYEGSLTADASLSNPVAVTINTPPVVIAPDDQFAVEGVSNLFNLGALVDPSSSTITVTVDWGDDTPPETFTVAQGGLLPDLLHTFVESGSYTVTLIVNDGEFDSDPRNFQVQVANIAPRLLPPGPNFVTLPDDGMLTLPFTSVVDPGVTDPIRIIIDWGDGTPLTVIDLDPEDRTLDPESLTHFFGETSEFGTITITVIDDDGGESREIVRVAPPNFSDDLFFLPDDDVGGDDSSPLEEGTFDPFQTFDPSDLARDEIRDDLPAAKEIDVEFLGIELIRQDLPRFGPPMAAEVVQPQLPTFTVPVAPMTLSRNGTAPSPISPLNEKSPLGTPLSLFHSVFDSDDSVNLIDSVRREMAPPTQPVQVTPTTPTTPTGGSTSMLPPVGETLPATESRPSWLVPILAALGVLSLTRSRRRSTNAESGIPNPE
jgi:hypothetical protein